MFSNSGVASVAGLATVAHGLAAFDRDHGDRTAAGGYGPRLTPGGGEPLSVVVVRFALGMMFPAVIGY